MGTYLMNTTDRDNKPCPYLASYCKISIDFLLLLFSQLTITYLVHNQSL